MYSRKKFRVAKRSYKNERIFENDQFIGSQLDVFMGDVVDSLSNII